MRILKDKFVFKITLRYLFHVLILLLFALTLNWYLFFQNLIIHSLSKIKYADDINTGKETFMYIIFFVAICYRADYRILNRVKLTEYFIPLLMFSDILCLLIANLTLIFCVNIAFEKYGWANSQSLSNALIAGAVITIMVKNWAVEKIIKGKRDLLSEHIPYTNSVEL